MVPEQLSYIHIPCMVLEQLSYMGITSKTIQSIMKHILCLLLAFICGYSQAQVNLDYQKPPQEILDLVDIELAPSVMMDEDKNYMVFRYRSAYKTLAELSETEMRLAGLRINPRTNIGSRTNYYTNVRLRKMNAKANSPVMDITGMPAQPRLANFSWSPDQTKICFTNTVEDGVELWYLDLATATAHKLTDANINANMGDVINWFEDSQHMLVKMLPANRKPLIDKSLTVPSGPTISISEGEKAQNRTYQDLLKDKSDEHNFEQLATSEVYKVALDGSATKFMDAQMYSSISFSPDGSYIMVNHIKRPFSYIVPYGRFPSETNIYTQDGQHVSKVLEVPLTETLPKGFMSTRPGRRNISWRSDKPASLTYVVALDGGDPAKEMEYRDEVFLLEAPFTGEGTSIFKSINRFSGIGWCTDDMAMAYDYWWNTRNTKAYIFNPSKPHSDVRVVFDRNYQDRYSDPGSPVYKRNEYGSYVIDLKDDHVFLLGAGYTEQGQFPFLDKMNVNNLTKKRMYQSNYTDKLETLSDFDSEKNQLMVRIQSATDYPNYFIRDLKSGKLKQLTDFANPFESIQDVHKEIITYKREDGLELSGTLYLPVGYDTIAKEKMPMILWAYPREYKDKSSASQNTQNPNEFTYPFWGSPLYWVTKGYVVLDDAAFPIVGEGDEEPNDSFRSQLVDNAKAAIDAVDEMGYIDRNRVAVGGHSYGAFMVANLLSHSDLFAAGIARSGAYNRTLTPFGFQSEERSYWEAPEVYYTMSPFMHADKMKTPLLLVHGEADNNSGTYPLQSERYFNALKGLGATVRLVMLPKESHGYRAKESILHLLWEQDQWLDKHVKNREMAPAQP